MPGRVAKFLAKRRIGRQLRGDPGARGLRLGRCLKHTAETTVFLGTKDGRAVVVKQIHGPLGPEHTAAHAAELGYQHARMRAGPYRVPEPVHARPAEGLIIMERAPGRRFDHELAAHPERRAELLAEAGRWLAHYTADRRKSDRFGGGYWVKRRDGARAAAPPGPDRDRLAALVALMRREKTGIGEATVTRARSHGDFSPLNLLVAGDEIWGVDIQNSHWLALAKDIARFLVYVEIKQPHGAHDGPGGIAAADLRAVISAEGLLPPHEAQLLLPFFLASELAGHLSGEARDPEILANARLLADRMTHG